MTEQTLLPLLLIVCTMWNTAKAQFYAIKSFEGQPVKIELTEVKTEKSWYIAKVSCLTDSLFLVDYKGVKETHILSDKFLEIVYDTRGGSGYKARNTVILSVKKNKIIVAMLANSFGQAFGGNIDGSLYAVKFNMIANTQSNFRLLTHIYDRHKSSSSPEKNYVRSKTVILHFDSVRNIFYSIYKHVARSFIINNPGTQQSIRQEINESLPVVVLGEDYYYLKGDWYKQAYDSNLFKEYYR